MGNQDMFRGNRDDLDAFLKLVGSPIRNPARSVALEDWRRYKASAMLKRFGAGHRTGGRPLNKGWNMLARSERLIDLSGINLDGAILGFVDLRGVRLDGASLRGAWLKSAAMENASLREATFAPVDAGTAYTGYSRLLGSDLSHADLSGADLSFTDLSGVNLHGASLRDATLRSCDLGRANLVGADLRGTVMTQSRIHGISAWDVSVCGDETLRHELIVTPLGEPEIRVDDIEIAQLIYLLLNRKKLANVIDAVTRRGVLILGRFRDGGLPVLQGIAEGLRRLHYVPLLFDSEPPESRDLTETALIVAGLARFVIADISGPSVLKELEAIAKDIRLPVIPILQTGRKPPSLFKSLLKFDWVDGNIIQFDTPEVLYARLEEAIVKPAEAMLSRTRRTEFRLTRIE